MGKLTSHLKHSTFQHAFNSRYWLGKSWRQQSPNPSCNSPSANRVPRRGVSSSSLLNVMVNVSSIFSPTASPVAIVYHLCLFSYVSTVAGVLTSFPAITSGLFEAYAMVSAKGLDLSNPVIKTTLIHAGLNDLVIFGAVYNMLSRWGNEAYMPTGRNTLVSFLMLGGVGYAAFLGGGLVYTHGVGVQRMGKGKEEKDAEVAKEKVEAKKEL